MGWHGDLLGVSVAVDGWKDGMAFGIDFQGGSFVLETTTDVFDGGDSELETHCSCC